MESRDLTRAYLRRLKIQSRVLPLAQRRELLTDIREHIQTSLEGVPSEDIVYVREVLDRLGAPPTSSRLLILAIQLAPTPDAGVGVRWEPCSSSSSAPFCAVSAG